MSELYNGIFMSGSLPNISDKIMSYLDMKDIKAMGKASEVLKDQAISYLMRKNTNIDEYNLAHLQQRLDNDKLRAPLQAGPAVELSNWKEESATTPEIGPSGATTRRKSSFCCKEDTLISQGGSYEARLCKKCGNIDVIDEANDLKYKAPYLINSREAGSAKIEAGNGVFMITTEETSCFIQPVIGDEYCYIDKFRKGTRLIVTEDTNVIPSVEYGQLALITYSTMYECFSMSYVNFLSATQHAMPVFVNKNLVIIKAIRHDTAATEDDYVVLNMNDKNPGQHGFYFSLPVSCRTEVLRDGTGLVNVESAMKKNNTGKSFNSVTYKFPGALEKKREDLEKFLFSDEDVASKKPQIEWCDCPRFCMI